MVVHENDGSPMEVPLSKPNKKFVVVKNHVRELLTENQDSTSLTSETQAEQSNVKSKCRKRKKPSELKPTEISESDLEDLRSVYKKCKAVLHKIELKYGHLLDCTESAESFENTGSEESGCDYCSCSQKKKIVFDENGEQIQTDCLLENHICLKKIKKNHAIIQPQKSPSVQIEYGNTDTNLPNNLQELENILKDVSIDKSLRRMVIDKIYLIRQEYLTEMRYERQDIIKQLKDNPDEVLNFKGTNLSSLPGYPTEPIQETKK